MTPSDLLRAYAQLAEQHPLEMLSAGGPDLQRAFVAFLRSTADAGDGGTEVMSDLALLIARNFVAVSMAFHNGRACLDCIDAQAGDLGAAIGAEIDAQNSQSPENPKGMH